MLVILQIIFDDLFRGIFNFFLHIIGRVYLFIRYRNKNCVREILKTKFNNSYKEAAKSLVEDFFWIIAVIIALLFFSFVIIGGIRILISLLKGE